MDPVALTNGNPAMTPAQLSAMGPLNKCLVVTSSALSFFGCLITFITYLLFKDLQTSSRHIIVCISIADFFTCVANIFGLPHVFVPPVDLICQLQSFIGSTFMLSSFLWTVSLAVFLYITIVKERKDLADRLIWPWFHLICWLVPLAINVIALCLQVLGNSGDNTSSGWCWIDLYPNHLSRRDQIIWMFLDGKGIEILSYIVVLVLYVHVKLHLKKVINSYEKCGSVTLQFIQQKTVAAAKNADRKLVLIPFCFVLLRIWGTIRIFIAIFTTLEYSQQLTTLNHVLLHLQAIGDNLQGFVNCLLFCLMTSKVRARIASAFEKHFCCWDTSHFNEERLLPPLNTENSTSMN